MKDEKENEPVITLEKVISVLQDLNLKQENYKRIEQTEIVRFFNENGFEVIAERIEKFGLPVRVALGRKAFNQQWLLWRSIALDVFESSVLDEEAACLIWEDDIYSNQILLNQKFNYKAQ